MVWNGVVHVETFRQRANSALVASDQIAHLLRDVHVDRVGAVGRADELMRLSRLDLAEVAHHEDVGLLPYSPLAAGLLTGKYRNGAVPAGSRGAINGDLGGRLQPLQEPAGAAYAALAAKHGLNLAQMALAFCLTRPFNCSTIIGATSMEQLKTDIGAADITLSDEVMKGIAQIHREYPMSI